MTTTTPLHLTQQSDVSTSACSPLTMHNRITKDFDVSPEIADVLYHRSAEGQLQREKMLFGKNIIFVCCGGDITKADIYERAKELGINSFVIEDKHSRLVNELQTRKVITHLLMDMSQRESLVNDCIALIDSTMMSINCKAPDAVVTFWDDAVSLTARLAAHYNCRSNTVEAIDRCHDKSETRKALAQSGLPSPQFKKISSREVLVKEGSSMLYPAILKPCLGAASIGVYRCENYEDALKNYDLAIESMKVILDVKELMGLTFDDTSTPFDFILEEFLDGNEVDIDMVLVDGEAVYANVNDDWPAVEPWYCEMGVSFPSNEPQERVDRYKKSALEHCRALGIFNGVVHVEMKWSTRYGPALIEVNPRMGGGPLRLFHLKAWGVDLATEHLLSMAGLPCNPPTFPTRAYNCACIFLFPEKSGVIAEDMDTSALSEEIRKMDYVTYCKYSTNKGDDVVGWWDGYPSHAGRVDVCVHVDEMSTDEVDSYCKELRVKSSNLTYA